jgi:hypothetical protein
MGGTSSKATVNALNSACTNAVQDTMASCVSTASQAQLVDITSAGPLIMGSVTQKQGVAINSDCVMSAQTTANIQSAITNALVQAATATGSGVTSALGASKSETEANIRNMVQTNITQKTVQEAVTSSVQSQAVKAQSGSFAVIGNISQEQAANIIAKAIISSNGAAAVINTVANDINQRADAKTTNPIADIIGSIGEVFANLISKPLMIIFAIILIIVGGAVIASRMGKPSEQAASGEQEKPAPLENKPPNTT